ncbi:hypothetical protein WJX73_005196 [Symbiochloris irregularis]|uniref:Proline dehydrogenase n=1 Tax=Symbiochloris irregularis TaxID=706552 RepID=A0AAW1NQY7_9CHLO
MAVIRELSDSSGRCETTRSHLEQLDCREPERNSELVPPSTGGMTLARRLSHLPLLSAPQALASSASQASQVAVFNTSVAPRIQPALAYEEEFYTAPAPRVSALPPFSRLCFNDPQQCFAAKGTADLARSLAVLRFCGLKPFVANAEWLFNSSKQVLGERLVNGVVKGTFFRQFCAGETSEDIQPTLAFLRRNGVSYCLNFSGEADVDEQAGPCTTDAENCPEELERDAIAQRFLNDLNRANNVDMTGFVAIKVSALGPPNLLEAIAAHLASRGDPCNRGQASADLRSQLQTVLSAEDLRAFERMLGRLHLLAKRCHDKGNMRMMVDAEQSYMQPAIDALVIHLQQHYNRTAPTVFNTYQCYLRDAPMRVWNDLERARKEGWCFGAKTVRGAYMHVERARAQQLGYADPIWPDIDATHHSYNRCVAEVLDRAQGEGAELMVASHNQESVELALEKMHSLHMPRSSGVYFGTLLGMADHLALTLGGAGYRAYKMVPYGPVEASMAYLLRRALENSDMLGGCQKELVMMQTEILRRMKSRVGLSDSGKAVAWNEM